MSGARIIEGLKAAKAGKFSRVTIDGQEWVRTAQIDAEEKIKQIVAVYETERPMDDGHGMMTNHIRYNLEGALYDMERTGKADASCIRTVKRAIDQLVQIEAILGV